MNYEIVIAIMGVLVAGASLYGFVVYKIRKRNENDDERLGDADKLV